MRRRDPTPSAKMREPTHATPGVSPELFFAERHQKTLGVCETNPRNLSVVSRPWSVVRLARLQRQMRRTNPRNLSVVSCAVLTIAEPGAWDSAVAGSQNSTNEPNEACGNAPNEPKVNLYRMCRHATLTRNRRERTQGPSVSNAPAPLPQQRAA
jgi:hypothetical protein